MSSILQAVTQLIKSDTIMLHVTIIVENIPSDDDTGESGGEDSSSKTAVPTSFKTPAAREKSASAKKTTQPTNTTTTITEQRPTTPAAPLESPITLASDDCGGNGGRNTAFDRDGEAPWWQRDGGPLASSSQRNSSQSDIPVDLRHSQSSPMQTPPDSFSTANSSMNDSGGWYFLGLHVHVQCIKT